MIAPIGKTQYDPLWRAIPIGIPDEDENAGPSVAQPPATMPESAPIGTTASAAPAPAVKAVPIGNPVLEAHQKRLGYLQRSGSGIDQITHPVDEEGNQAAQHVGLGKKVLSGLAHVGDAVGGAMFPAVMAGIPGTTLHHDMLIGQAERAVGNDLAEEKSQAQANEQNARADALRNPPEKDGTMEKVIVSMPDGSAGFANHNTKTGQYFDLAGNVLQGAKPYEKPEKQPTQTFEEQTFDEWKQTHPSGTRMDFEKERAAMVRKPEGDGGSFMPLYDKEGNVAGAWNPKTGELRNAPSHLPGTTSQGRSIGDKGSGLTTSTRTMIEAAPKVKTFVDRINTLIDQQEKTLGPAASRWNEFMAGKVGAPNADFTKLRTDVGLLQTLLMRMHVGARGGEYIMKHFQDLIDSSKQSPENLRAALGEIKDYADELEKQKAEGGEQQGAPKVGDVKKFPNGKTGTWDGHGWVSQ